MRSSVVNNIDFQVMFQKVQIVLHPFFALRFKLFEWIEFNLILSSCDVLSFDIVLFREFFEPKRRPHEADVSNH